MRGCCRNSTVRRIKRCDLYDGITQSPEFDEFVWPSTAEISQTQQAHPKPKSTRNDNGIWKIGRAVWIPENCDNLKLRLLTISHAGRAAHRGAEAA